MHCMMSILKCYWFLLILYCFLGSFISTSCMLWPDVHSKVTEVPGKRYENQTKGKSCTDEKHKKSANVYLKAYLKEPGVTQRWTEVIPRAQAIVWSSIGTDSAAETVEAVDFNLQYSCLMLTRLFETSAKVLQSTGSDSALQDKLAVKTFSKQDIWRHSCKEITSAPKTLHPMLILARLNM